MPENPRKNRRKTLRSKLRGFKLISNYSEYMRSDNVLQVYERFS